MKMTFRWYGEGNDTVQLQQIRQIPEMTGIMGVLDDIPAGEVWPADRIADYVAHVNSHGLEVEVIESVNIHEDIKLGAPSRDRYIDNYIQTMVNLAGSGIRVIIYNFMPVFDWVRTDLTRRNADGSTSFFYDENELRGMTPQALVAYNASKADGFTFSGWEPQRLAELDRILVAYEDVDQDQLFENYRYFLERVIPHAEELGIRLAIHPDDPAWPVFGIPRLAHSQALLDRILALYDSPAHALCLCTGSLGSDPENRIPEMIARYGQQDRIAAMHVRNVRYIDEGVFIESAHPTSYGDLDMYAIMQAIYEHCPDVYIRPDHGRAIWDERARAGYGLYDRALGAVYLIGLWEAISRAAGDPPIFAPPPTQAAD